MIDKIRYEDIKSNPLLREVSETAAAFGVVATVIVKDENSNFADSGFYLVAGLGKYPEYENVKDLEYQTYRNPTLFHPKGFAIQLTLENVNKAIEDLYDYCTKAEIVNTLYTEYNVPVPDVIRCRELEEISTYASVYRGDSQDTIYKQLHKEALDKFFSTEKKALKSKGLQSWFKYFRSDNYNQKDKEPSLGIRLRPYPSDQEIPLNLLTDNYPDISVLHLDESEYQNLKQEIKKYPEVYYSVGEKLVIDTGEIKNAPEDNPFAGTQSHFEIRDVYIKKIDEPFVYGIICKDRFKDMNIPSRYTLTAGSLEAHKISYELFDAFNTVAKDQGLKFAVDYDGKFMKPSSQYVPVLIESVHIGKFRSVCDAINDFVTGYHAPGIKPLPELTNQIRQAQFEEKVSRVKTRVKAAQSRPTHETFQKAEIR